MKKYLITICILGLLFGTYSFVHSASKTLRIVALGDSITYGTGDPDKKGYIYRTKLQLQNLNDVHVKMENFAIPKYTTENILEQLRDEEILKQIRKADRLILFIGTNDFRKSASYHFQKLKMDDIHEGKKIYLHNLKRILGILRDENVNVPIMVIGLFQAYVEYDNHREIQKVIEDWNMGIVKTISGFNLIYFVPTMDLFLGKNKEDYFSDSLHPNPNGYQLIADRLVEEIIHLEGK